MTVRDMPYIHSIPEINGMRVISYKTLGDKVLTVLVHKLYDNAYSVYIAPVPGNRHIDEIPDVMRHGYCLPYHIAEAIYPYHFNDLIKQGLRYTS